MTMMKPTTFGFNDQVAGRMTASALLRIVLFLGCFVQNVCSYSTLTAEEFYNLKDTVNVIVDVRTQSEWDSGHIEGAMHVDSLSLYGTELEISSPSDLAGCEYCDIIVYCRSGSRAGQALTLLEAAGFAGNLYNGLGVSQWSAANYPLVTNSPSTAAPCTVNATVRDQCSAK
jgi:rhodanese-related sulfurtransferase